MKVFVTGGTGLVGKKAIERFCKQGVAVHALARSDSSAKHITSLGAVHVIGSLENLDTWKSVLKDCDTVVHCAAPVEFWGEWKKFEDGIVVATTNLFKAAMDAGVRRFVHISSESVLQDIEPLMGIDEAFPYPATPNSFYGLAKKQAELALLSFQSATELVILRPSFVWGKNAAALAQVAEMAKAGKFMWASKGICAFEWVHVDNLAEAIFCAAKAKNAKGVYFVTDDEPIDVYGFFSHYFTAIGIKVPTQSLPNVLIKTLAAIVESIWKVLGIKSKPPLTRFDWAFIGMPRRYNIAKIKKDLGYSPVISREAGFKELSSGG